MTAINAMARSYRLEKINDAIKELLGELLLSRIKDPRIGFITITSVKIASDMMSAKVYYSVMGREEDKRETLRGLESAKSYLRKTIGRELKLRYAPELRFVYDDSLDRSIAIEEVLRKIRKEGDEKS